MTRPRRPLTDEERASPCSLCGARAGERCTRPGGGLYPGTHAARRVHNRRGYSGEYAVTLCGHCSHPGGQHILGRGCRLCQDCPGWDEESTIPGSWSDHMTDRLLGQVAGPRALDDRPTLARGP